MSFLGQCIIGTLAAIGFICILKTVYDIIFTGSLAAWGRAALYLYGDGADERCATLIEAAEQIRRLYLPSMEIVFVETGDAPPEAQNYAARLAARHAVTYINTR